MSLFTHLLVIVSLGAFGGTFAYHAPLSSGGAEIAWETVVLLAPPSCDFQCWENCTGSNNHMNDQIGSGGGNHGGDQHDCETSEGGSCNANHSCSPDPVPAPETDYDLDEGFWLSMQDASGESIHSFLASNPGIASFNSDRQSIQVLGCTERVTINVPLDDAQVNYLEEALDLN